MSLTEGERFLLGWHALRPGETSRVLGHLRDDAGQTSYDHLLAFAHPGDRVLDLCCGDGFLLEGLLDRGASAATGIDLCPEELAAARDRLGDRARLVEGRAQELPFEDGSFDLVTCHLALMLLLPVDPVIAEVLRVLRPGGRFAAVVGGPSRAGDAWHQLMAAVGAAPRNPMPLGDPRARAEPGLRDLLSGFEQVEVHAFTVRLSGTPAEIWAHYLSSYNPELMPEEARPALERAFWEELAASDPATGLLEGRPGRRLATGIRPQAEASSTGP